MSRTKRYLAGLWLTLGSMAVSTVVGISYSKFLLVRLGQHDYGVWLVVAQILAFVDLVDLGTCALLGRYVANAIGEAGGLEKAKELPTIIGRLVVLTLWQMPLVFAIAIGLYFCLPSDWKPLGIPLLVIFVSWAGFFLLRIPRAVLSGLQALTDQGWIDFVAWSLTTAMTFVLIFFFHMGFGALAVTFIVKNVFMTSAFSWRLVRRYPQVIPRRLPRLDGTHARVLIKSGVLVSIQRLGLVFLNASDNLIVDRGMSTSAVVPYACTNRAYSVLENVPRAFLDMARPGLTEARASSSREHIASVCNSLSLATMVVSGFVVSVTFAVNRAFVLWWVGDAQWGGQALSLVLGGALLFRAWITALNCTAFAFSLDGRLTSAMVLDGLATVVCSIALVGKLGYIAIPIGQVFGGAVAIVPLVLTAVAKDVGLTPMDMIRPLFPWAWRFVLCLAGAGAIAQHYTPQHLLPLIATAAGASLAYVVIMYPCVMDSSLGRYVRPRLESLRARVLKRA